MKIAVVDDSAQDLSAEIDYLSNYISNYYHGLSDNLKINGFQSAADFLNSFETYKFDLIILDIVMKDMNGIDIAKIIREKDKSCNIVFVTSSEDFLIDGYSVFAIGYFIKPINEHENEFNKMFEYIYPKLEKSKELIIRLIRNINLNVPYDDIYCVDINENHKLRIITKNQELITTMTYQECQQILLSDKRFLECHYRIIINMDYITSMKSEDFILKNGIKIPISNRRKRESKIKYMDYLLHKND